MEKKEGEGHLKAWLLLGLPLPSCIFFPSLSNFFSIPSFNHFKVFKGVYCHLDCLGTLMAQNSLTTKFRPSCLSDDM